MFDTPGESVFNQGGSIFDQRPEDERESGGSIFANTGPVKEQSVFERASARTESMFESSGPDLISQYQQGPDLERQDLFAGQDLERQEISLADTYSPAGMMSEPGLGEDHLLYRMDAQEMGITDPDKYKASYLLGEEGSGMAMLNVRGSRHGNLNLIDRMRGVEANFIDLDNDSVSLAESYSDKTLDKRVMNGAYNVTLTDVYSDAGLFMAFHGLYTDGIVKVRDKTYNVDTFSQVDEGGLNGSLYAENVDKEDHAESVFSKIKKEREEARSMFEEKSAAQSENRMAPHEFLALPLEERLKMIQDGKVPDGVDPGTVAKTKKEEQDLKEKEHRDLLKEQRKLEKERAKQAKRDQENSAYEEYLRKSNCESKPGGCSMFSDDDSSTPSVIDVLMAANSAKQSAGKEKVDEQTFSMMTQQEQARVIRENRAPDSIPQAEKDRILRAYEELEEELGGADQARENVFDHLAGIAGSAKEEPKSIFEAAAKKLSEAEFKYLPEDEKLRAFERGETPDDLDALTLQELKEKLAREEELRRNAGGLENHEEAASAVNAAQGDAGSENPAETFKNLPLEERLKLIRSGKVPEGVEPALVAKALKEEKDLLEKEKRIQEKLEKKHAKALEKAAAKELETAELVAKLRADNMRSIVDEAREDAKAEEAGLTNEDEAEVVKKLKERNMKGGFPLRREAKLAEEEVVMKLRELSGDDSFYEEFDQDEQGEFEHFQNTDRPEQSEPEKKEKKKGGDYQHELLMTPPDLVTGIGEGDDDKHLCDLDEIAERLDEQNREDLPLGEEEEEDEKILDDNLLKSETDGLLEELEALAPGLLEAGPGAKSKVSIRDIEVLKKKRKQEEEAEEEKKKTSVAVLKSDPPVQATVITVEELEDSCFK